MGAAGVVGVEVAELDGEDGRLDFVEAAVATAVLEYIFAGRAVVGEGADGAGEVGIVGGHGAAVAQGAEVLAGVEAVACGMTQ